MCQSPYLPAPVSLYSHWVPRPTGPLCSSHTSESFLALSLCIYRTFDPPLPPTGSSPAASRIPIHLIFHCPFPERSCLVPHSGAFSLWGPWYPPPSSSAPQLLRVLFVGVCMVHIHLLEGQLRESRDLALHVHNGIPGTRDRVRHNKRVLNE